MVAPARADAGFDRWVQDFWPTAKAAGVSRAIYDAAFRGVTPDPEVLEKARYQPEFATPLWDYVSTRVSEKRIDAGRDMLVRYRSLLDKHREPLRRRPAHPRRRSGAWNPPTARCSPTRRS